MNEFGALKQAEHEALLSGKAGPMLRDPANSRLFYGFDSLTRLPPSDTVPVDQLSATITYDALLQLCAAVGVRRTFYPEARVFPRPSETEALLEALDRVFAFQVTFPNPFPGEIGLATSRGVATYRSIQALYQAWRVAGLLAGIRNPRVLEIGPGLGRTAFYAFRLGIRDYTLIDIPLSAAAQGYFLGRVLGEDAVRLYGEPNGPPVTVAPPNFFLDGHEQYDLVLNVDSLTEMPREAAEGYWTKIQTCTPTFLSINHEYNRLTFRTLYTASGHAPKAGRVPYWLRRGYVEELVNLR